MKRPRIRTTACNAPSAPLTAGASLREQERNQAMTDETVEGTLRIALEQRRLAVKDDEI